MSDGTRREGVSFSGEFLVSALHEATGGNFPADAVILGLNWMPHSYGMMVFYTNDEAPERPELTVLAPADVGPKIVSA